MANNRPVHNIRVGKIRVAVWANSGANGTWFNVTVSRSFKNGKGEWQDSSGFALQDIPLVCRLLDQAYDYVFNLPRLPGSGEGEEAPANYDTSESSYDLPPVEPA